MRRRKGGQEGGEWLYCSSESDLGGRSGGPLSGREDERRDHSSFLKVRARQSLSLARAWAKQGSLSVLEVVSTSTQTEGRWTENE